MTTEIEITTERVTIWSEGSRLAADVYHRADLDAPTSAIMLCHGWGGVRPHLAPYARAFAERGHVALEIDHRGWGDSDGKLVPLPGTSPLVAAGQATVEVHVIRELTDPVDQVTDIRNALAYLRGDPRVDPTRVGIWGTSFGGGHAVFVASVEPQVRCAVAQIGYYPTGEEFRAVGEQRMSDRARGVLQPALPQDVDLIPGFPGTPDMARIVGYSPRDAATTLAIPTLIIDAEHEEVFDRSEHGRAVYESISQRAPAEYHTFPGAHYDGYGEYQQHCIALACDWYDLHLAAHLPGDGNRTTEG